MAVNETVYAVLREGFTVPIRDALWGHIYLTPPLAALTQSPAFIRLNRILQLGPANYTYPGATHTRAAHSIGVYHLARRLLTNLADRGAGEWLSPMGVYSFLCAALLHDAGHFPYTHSLKELPLSSHEELTGKIILSEPMKSLIGEAGADPYLSAAIVDSSLPGENEKELGFYRKILSGVLDPDKLDYLNRDARCCGVPYGAQDVDFIFSRLIPHQERGVDIDSKGIPSVEAILFSKYLMYRTVYWHRSVRSATAMIKKALLAGLHDGVIQKDELYNLDDQELFALMAARKHPCFSLAEKVRNGRLYTAAAEFTFDEKIHAGLKDLDNRPEIEKDLAEDLSQKLQQRIAPEELIIDVPEPVSFETGLYVSDENCYFSEGSTAFKAETLRSFVDSLRIIRIFVDPERQKGLQLSTELEKIMQNKKMGA